MTRLIYLHGFASGPQSKKAQYFRRRFAERGVDLLIPALADQGFENLTVTGQLRAIESLAGDASVGLIGSSLGGYLAALAASRIPNIERAVLLAPAFGFTKLWQDRLGAEGMQRWRDSRFLEVHHYAEDRPARVGYGLIEDGQRYPDHPSFTQPGLIFHGTRDDVVPPEASVRFAATNPNTRLQLFDSGHELTDVLDDMWPLVFNFSIRA